MPLLVNDTPTPCCVTVDLLSWAIGQANEGSSKSSSTKSIRKDLHPQILMKDIIFGPSEKECQKFKKTDLAQIFQTYFF